MTLSVWFWILFAIGLIFGFYVEYVPGQPYPYPRGFRWLLFNLLLLILGMQVFGSPVK